MSFIRVSCKTQAKEYLKNNYFKALAAAVILGMLGGSMNGSLHFSSYSSFDRSDALYLPSFSNGLATNNFSEPLAFFGIFSAITLFIVLFAFIFQIFIGGPAMIGGAKFFLSDSEEISILFSGFKQDFSRCAKTAFLSYGKIILGTFLFIIPGIIFAYELRFVPYILAENPEMTTSEVMAESKKLTDGIKADLWIMDLSFLGWIILGSLFFGIGQIFVAPYIEKSFANVYKQVAHKDDEYLTNGLITE